MIIVVAIAGLIAAISFPSVSSGIDSLRLTSASDSIVTFLNSALNRAERRQQLMEVTISIAENALWLRSSEPGFERHLGMPDGVHIVKLHPEIQGLEEPARSYILYPGGVVPQFGVELANRRGVHRIVRVDATTGVPMVEQIQNP
jgi:hypothetical protein